MKEELRLQNQPDRDMYVCDSFHGYLPELLVRYTNLIHEIKQSITCTSTEMQPKLITVGEKLLFQKGKLDKWIVFFLPV